MTSSLNRSVSLIGGMANRWAVLCTVRTINAFIICPLVSIFHQVTDGSVDTSPLRHAIFFYVQRLLGVTKEDYNYEDIPKYLGEQTRCYIQKVCHRPHLLDRNDWNSVGISLRSEEKCHMNLLIASARKQALLCYGLSLVSHV